MTRTIKRCGKMLARLHRDEKGAEGLEKLLIIAAVVLPLLGLLMYFKDEITDWVKDKWTEERDKADAYEY